MGGVKQMGVLPDLGVLIQNNRTRRCFFRASLVRGLGCWAGRAGDGLMVQGFTVEIWAFGVRLPCLWFRV